MGKILASVVLFLSDKDMIHPMSGFLLLIALFMVFAACSKSKTETTTSVAFPEIDAGAVMRHTQILSSDEYEGRAPGTKGEDLTVAYITDQFEQAELEPGNMDGSYVQKIPMVGITVDPGANLAIRKGKKNLLLKFKDDFVPSTKQVNDKTRNMVRRAQKKGVEVRVSAFDEAMVTGIAKIYNETPFRQGRKFWHYGKDIDSVRKDNSSFLERSEFIGAYSGQELIGFTKLVYMREVAGIMQILSMVKERDKAPNNALVAKTVELCAEKGVRYLFYSKFTYGKKGVDPLADFKKHNAFQKMEVPKYYIPLTTKGNIGLKLGLHHELFELLPQSVTANFRRIRERWYGWKIRKMAENKQ